MRRIATLFICLVFLGSLSLAQNPSDKSGTDSRMAQNNQTSSMDTKGMHEMSQMHEQMMKEMQADLDSMHSNLQKMKDQIGKVQDQEANDQLRLNIGMWQSLLDHMDKHMTMMKRMMTAHEGRTTDGTKRKHEHVPSTPKQ